MAVSVDQTASGTEIKLTTGEEMTNCKGCELRRRQGSADSQWASRNQPDAGAVPTPAPGEVAQLVERRFCKPKVAGSTPVFSIDRFAVIAQLAERVFGKDEVPGSIPGGGSKRIENRV